MSKKTRKEVRALINQKFVFPNMNILMYADNYIFTVARKPHNEGVQESNRELIYQLYNFALKLEPEKKPELTFSQRMIVNRARSFITKRMKHRLEMRSLKKGKKMTRKMKLLLSDEMMKQFQQQIEAQQLATKEQEHLDTGSKTENTLRE